RPGSAPLLTDGNIFSKDATKRAPRCVYTINGSIWKPERGDITEKEDLVSRLKKDDQDALGDAIALYSRLVASVVRWALGDFRGTADAEALTADVFLALWENRKRLSEGHLKGFLTVTARNTARSWLRRKRPEEACDPEDLIKLSDEEAEGLEDESVRRMIVEKLLGSLDPETRRIFAYYYFYGLTAEETAAATGINPSTVKSRLVRGRRKLRDLMKEMGDETDEE
ncbi:MAG: sigma-70 family RNA polymerase sigma factor, partial [Clostridia bacterium]|nr:sigma-70 family RNA polymerase sigma factor [Clostridia bacterium]